MVCCVIAWQDFDTLRWHKMCEDLLLLIDAASASSLSDPQQSHEGKHPDRTKAREVARAILRDIDVSYFENIQSFRRRAEGALQSNPDHAKREDAQYSQWRRWSNVSESRYSDQLIQRLLKIAGPNNIFDDAGFMFWRVRRLMEMQGEDEHEDAKRDARIEVHGGTQSLEEEPETKRAEPEAHPRHGQSSTVPGTLTMVDELMESGWSNSSNMERGELWRGTTDVPIYRDSVLTHN